MDKDKTGLVLNRAGHLKAILIRLILMPVTNLYQTLDNLYGTGKNTGRLIYRAWANTQGRANASIIRALENATDRFDKRTATVDIRRAA